MNNLQKLIARLLIPRGYYCDGCPFHFIDKSGQEQANGYCSYLGKTDIQINSGYPEMIEIEQRQADGTYTKKLFSKYDKPFFNSFSLLWDGCKECGVNLCRKGDKCLH